jgi:DhnA family fructose-bisphosphate aldolase class Ia
MTEFDIQQAQREIGLKSKVDIEMETAIRWGARAVAAYYQYASTGDTRWLVEATEYASEATEHAAGVSGSFVNSMQDDIKMWLSKAGIQ